MRNNSARTADGFWAGIGGRNNGHQKPLDSASVWNALINTLSCLFTPILPALMGAGLIKGVIAVLQIFFPEWAASGDGSFIVVNAAGDTLIYFLPVLIAFSAAQRFGLDPILGLVIGGTLVYPNITELYPFGPWSLEKFFGARILVIMRYSGTVLPSIFAVYGAAKLYQYLHKKIHSAIKIFIAPFLTVIIIVPLTFLMIGPVFGIVGLGIQSAIRVILGFTFIGHIILGAVIGGFWQVLVILGLHWAVVTVGIQEATMAPNIFFGRNGVSAILAYVQIAVIAQLGAVFAMALRMKNIEQRSAAVAAGISGIFGITEPIIFGFTLPRKKPFFTACIIGAVFGALAALAGNLFSEGRGIVTQLGALGVFSYPGYILPDYAGSAANFLIAFLASILSMCFTFITVYLNYEPETAELQAVGAVVIDTSKVNIKTAKKIYAPVKGRIFPITQSADPVHREAAVGQGVCFMPLGGKIFAPFDGTVELIFNSHHAIKVKSDEGIEILIHVGIDTIKLDGRGFHVHVTEGKKVKTGQPMLEYDKDIIARAGFNLETQMVITNTADFRAITQAKTGDCMTGDLVLYVE
ncbi:MAG: glucose PTS transporter subunit IIA [Treponema sp.]|jgi:PTS system beta-glucosides-specific IIC component|nr:glucose PTS transporter subunit IIA [Treponema sp.]